MKNPNYHRRTVRYTGNGHWEQVSSERVPRPLKYGPEPVMMCAGDNPESITREWYREMENNYTHGNAFVRAHLNGDWDACTARTLTDPQVVVEEDPNDIWASKPGSIEHREWQRKCDKALNQMNESLELRKDASGVYKWES